MKINPPKQDRETIMHESREPRLLLWELLMLRYSRRQLVENPIPVDEILPELKQVLNTLHGKNKKKIFKIWQHMRLWPPPEILHDQQEQVLECSDQDQEEPSCLH